MNNFYQQENNRPKSLEEMMQLLLRPKPQSTTTFVSFTYDPRTLKASMLGPFDNKPLAILATAKTWGDDVPSLILRLTDTPRDRERFWTDISYWLADQDVIGCENLPVQRSIHEQMVNFLKGKMTGMG